MPYFLSEAVKGAEAVTEIQAQPYKLQSYVNEEKASELNLKTAEIQEKEAEAEAPYREAVSQWKLQDFMSRQDQFHKSLGESHVESLTLQQQIAQEQQELNKQQKYIDSAPGEMRPQLEAQVTRCENNLNNLRGKLLTLQSKQTDDTIGVLKSVDSETSLQAVRSGVDSIASSAADAAISRGQIDPSQREAFKSDTKKKLLASLPQHYDAGGIAMLKATLGTMEDSAQQFKDMQEKRMIAQSNAELARARTYQQALNFRIDNAAKTHDEKLLRVRVDAAKAELDIDEKKVKESDDQAIKYEALAQKAFDPVTKKQYAESAQSFRDKAKEYRAKADANSSLLKTLQGLSTPKKTELPASWNGAKRPSNMSDEDWADYIAGSPPEMNSAQ